MCIRLKKDCSFFPVDQQPQMDRRPRASSNRIDTRGSTSSDSSPAIAGGHMFDPGDDFNSYPHLTVPVAYPPHRGSIGGLSPLSGISPMTKGEVYSRRQKTFEWKIDIIQLLLIHKHLSFRHRTVHLGDLLFRAMGQPQPVTRHPVILRIATGVDIQTPL